MKKVHFVYSTPLSWSNFLDKITMKFFYRLISHRFPNRFIYPDPLCSPFSISKLLIEGIKSKYVLRYYDLRERVTIKPEQGDVLIGHMWLDKKSVMWNSFDNKKFSKRVLISPYNHDPKQVGWFKSEVEKCDLYFAISGDYWFKNLELSPFKEYKHKMIQLNMFVERKYYPWVKKTFRPKGERRFFYIGRYGVFGDEKGVGILEELANKINGFDGGYICTGGAIKGWRKISDPRKLDKEFMSKIAEEYDFFINLSRHDAQATTILEAMSWGFPVLCTPESGYGDDLCMGVMSLTDIELNIETIQKYQEMDESELSKIVEMGWEILDKKYSPEVFLNKVLTSLENEIN